MRVLLIVALAVVLAGCSDNEVTITESERASVDKLFSTAEQTPELTEKWARSCALCHVNGEGGAPKMGDATEWQPRLAQGNAALYMHTLNGFNRMPPLGYCMDCSGQDYAAMINMLAGQAQ